MEVELIRDDIYNEVGKITAYTGLKAGNVDAVAVTDDERNILNTFWNEACDRLSEVLGKYVFSFSDDGTTICVQLNVPANWKQTNLYGCSRSMKQYLINALCEAWFGLSYPEKASQYQLANVALSTSLRVYLGGREKPVRE